MQGVYCPGDVHWARLEASALGSVIAACPAWKRREAENSDMKNLRHIGLCNDSLTMNDVRLLLVRLVIFCSVYIYFLIHNDSVRCNHNASSEKLQTQIPHQIQTRT